MRDLSFSLRRMFVLLFVCGLCLLGSASPSGSLPEKAQAATLISDPYDHGDDNGIYESAAQWLSAREQAVRIYVTDAARAFTLEMQGLYEWQSGVLSETLGRWKMPAIFPIQIELPSLSASDMERLVPEWKISRWQQPERQSMDFSVPALPIASVFEWAAIKHGIHENWQNLREGGSNLITRLRFDALAPSAGDEEQEPARASEAAADVSPPEDAPKRYAPESQTLNVEAVLTPPRAAVISSSRDGKIKSIPYHDGEMFRAGDTLIEYECSDLEAELEAVRAQSELAQTKSHRSAKLFKLDLISDIEHLDIAQESRKTEAQIKVLMARRESCIIKAEFDGRITRRLANPGEYTRTDRVLIEIASQDHLEAQFLMPSRWLRWVNTGAPVILSLSETDQTYAARIIRFQGEVDPVSQSIQVTAALDPYADPLLPGMSGQILIDLDAIRAAGIHGFLETKSHAARTP